MGTYRRGLRRVVGRSSVPYGYTAVTWTSGGMLIDTHGPPTFAGSLMFLAGAILGFSAVTALGGEDGEGRDGATQRHRRRLALTSGAAAIGGLCLAGLVAHDVDGQAAYFLVALVSTTVYFLIAALGMASIDRSPSP